MHKTKQPGVGKFIPYTILDVGHYCFVVFQIMGNIKITQDRPIHILINQRTGKPI